MTPLRLLICQLAPCFVLAQLSAYWLRRTSSVSGQEGLSVTQQYPRPEKRALPISAIWRSGLLTHTVKNLKLNANAPFPRDRQSAMRRYVFLQRPRQSPHR